MTASLRDIRFLVVDDSVNMLQIVRAVLTGFDARQVMSVQTPKAAMSALRDYLADIVILDMKLHNASGLELLTEIRASPDSAIAYLPVIMLTGYSEVGGVQAARDAGANEFCSKPLKPSSLYQKIVAVIERPRAFVRGGAYFGPDRRRKVDHNYRGPERRVEQQDARVG